MKFQVFFSGAAILALGAAAMNLLERTQAFAFLQGAATLGGGLIICGLFALKSQWHGIIGAGVLALLGAARGLGNFPKLATFLAGQRENGPMPLLEFGVTLICLVLLMRVLTALFREKTRRLLEKD
jgi:hypothetical protein